MKKILTGFILAVFFSFSAMAADFYELSAVTIKGDTLDFSELKGKKLMIVNTASQCGFTPQYEDLQKLYEEYGGPDFEILGFPCNQFGAQEPGSDEDIDKYCSDTWGVTFTMMSKIDVKGTNQHPVYAWLTKKSLNGVHDSEVHWNFQKYLINEAGALVGVYGSQTSPLNSQIKDWLGSVSSVEDLFPKPNSLDIYPNPAASVINLKSSGNISGEVYIYNLLGIKVLTARTSDSTVDVSGLPRGIYFIRYGNKTQRFTKE